MLNFFNVIILQSRVIILKVKIRKMDVVISDVESGFMYITERRLKRSLEE